MDSAAMLDWSQIDTVLLDMDGTLLDLRFDNWFWQEHLPAAYAARNGLSLGHARALLAPKFHASVGTLNWYCIEHWSVQLGLDVAALKQDVGEHVRFLPGARRFLDDLARLGKRRVLLTNAHPRTLEIKHAHSGVVDHVDVAYSTHAFGIPKENPLFWPRFRLAEEFDPTRTLFVDDSLPVLDAARGFGIRELRAIRRPDTGAGLKATHPFEGLDGVGDLFER